MTSYTHEELAEDLKAGYTDEQLASPEIVPEPVAEVAEVPAEETQAEASNG